MKKNIEKILYVGTVLLFLAGTGYTLFRIRTLERSVIALSERLETVKHRESGPDRTEDTDGDSKQSLNMLMTFAKIRNDIDRLSRKIRDLKRDGDDTGQDPGYSSAVRYQEDLWRRFSSSYRDFYVQQKDGPLSVAGFSRYERDIILENLSVMMKDLENAQAKWIRGDIDMQGLMERMREQGEQLRNYLIGDVGEKKAQKAIRILIDNPAYKQMLFPAGTGGDNPEE